MKNDPLEKLHQHGVAAMVAHLQAGVLGQQPTANIMTTGCIKCDTGKFVMSGLCAYCGEPITAPSQLKPDPLLEERGGTHGSFRENARISQLLKNAMRAAPGWAKLSDVQREALEMNALKVSRILSGKGGEAQHWEDVAGYANLVIIDEQQEK